MKVAIPTPTVEDYLGVIYTLERDGETVTGRKLAEWLEVSAPTVTETLQRMIRDGWIMRGKDRRIRLTRRGGEAAASLVRRHMLTELLLARVLGIPWSKVHEEADRIEHGLSSETADRVAELVEDASACPHGNPIPGSAGPSESWIPLFEAKTHSPYVLVRVHEEIERQNELMAYLERSRLTPGAEIVVEEVMPYNETISLQVAGERVVLGFAVARRLWVKEQKHGEKEKSE
jgi:DtxR family Mn-dependent transcriptional regulator